MDLNAFLKKLPSAKYYSSKFYKSYFKALEMYWFQKRRDVLSFIAKTIEEDIDHEDIHVFYRLWIEALAETHDRPSLQMLKNHLANLAPQFADYDQWAALRGLVHLELEELDACMLILRGIGDNTYSPYAMELRQRYEFRFSKDTQSELAILKCQAPVTDYFILQSLAQGLLAEGHSKELPALFSKIKDNFPHSPLQDHFLFWQNFEENKLDEAISVAKRLCKRFPDNERYRFDLGYVSFCKGKVHEAIQTLEGLDLKYRKQDPDTMALLGYGYLLECKDKVASQGWQKAKTYFTLAKAQSDRLGIPSNEILLNLNFMKEEEHKRSQHQTLAHGNFWALTLSPRRENELVTCAEQNIDFVFHELPKGIQDNDFVYFTSSKSEPLRLFAIYKVIQTQIWHPSEKNQGLLELVHRFSRSLQMPALGDRNILLNPKLSANEAENWLDQLEEHIPIRQKINVVAKKERNWKLQAYGGGRS